MGCAKQATHDHSIKRLREGGKTRTSSMEGDNGKDRVKQEDYDTNQLVGVVDRWARLTTPILAWFSAPILTWFSAPVLAPAPGLGSTPVLPICSLFGDVSPSGGIIEEGKWTDFVVYWGSEGSDGERE